jgi:hypothetical protein
LIARRRKTPLAITADLSICLVKVCPDVPKEMGLRIEDSLSPTSAHAQEAFSTFSDLQHPHFSVALSPKNRIENT